MTSIHNMFDHIVEDPFYSNKYNGMVVVDDHSRVYVDGDFKFRLDKNDDDIVADLFFEWASYDDTNGEGEA